MTCTHVCIMTKKYMALHKCTLHVQYSSFTCNPTVYLSITTVLVNGYHQYMQPGTTGPYQWVQLVHINGYNWSISMGTTGPYQWVQLVHINGYYMYLRSEDTLEVLPVIMDLLPDGQQQGIDLCVVGWGWHTN